MEQMMAKLEDKRGHQAATDAFAKLNGWRQTKSTSYNLGLLGRGASSRSLWDSSDFPLLDHCVWLRQDRRYVAVVGQPYLSAVDIVEERARLALRGLVLHLPPDPLASFHYPGWTLFVVVTKPDVTVKWLPEQDRRLKGLWRDWLNASPDYRAEAAAALLAATSVAAP
jgi:hypothetical protein